MNNAVFYDAKPRSLEETNPSLTVTCCLHLPGKFLVQPKWDLWRARLHSDVTSTTSVFACQYHSANVPYIHPTSMLYHLRN